jgi:hypothetical protein
MDQGDFIYKFRIIKKIHLMALFFILIIFIINIIFFVENKNPILLSFLFFPIPAFLYGKIWARNFFYFLKVRKIIRKKLLYAPSFITLYILISSYLMLSLLTKYTIQMKLIMVVEIWSVFYIFYTLGFVLTHIKNNSS